jgi:hypothetical protein
MKIGRALAPFVFVLPACVVRLTERNAADVNGGVTGPAADCKVVQPLPRGEPGGAPEPKFVGRYVFPPSEDPTQKTAVFDWSGNYINARFEGTDHVTVKIDLLGTPVPGQTYELVQDQMFEFVVDNLPPVARQITVKKDATGKPTLEPLEEYEITGLTPGPHEITIHKNTEAQKGAVQFKGFDLHGGHFLPPVRRARRIEFIGDSIICAYGNEGQNATCPFEVKVRDVKDPQGNPILGPNGQPLVVTVPLTENQYKSFTAQAARALDADAVTVCWSGKGVYKNYKERTVIDPATGQPRPEDDATTTVPQLWETRTIASDFEGAAKPKQEDGTGWDFAADEKPEDKPHVVFISLGTNDFARDTVPLRPPGVLPGDNIPDGDLNSVAERDAFFRAYLVFVEKVREKRPDAHIFLATPPMITDQFPLVDARRNLQAMLLRIVDERARAGDPKVYKMDLVEQGFRYGLGCDYHPNLEVHRVMAEQTIGAIRSKTCW